MTGLKAIFHRQSIRWLFFLQLLAATLLSGLLYWRSVIVARQASYEAVLSAITETGPVAVERFGYVKRLVFANPENVTDATVLRLAELENVEYINLQFTRVTAASVPALRKMKARLDLDSPLKQLVGTANVIPDPE